MAQTQILAAGTTTATSTDVTIAAGAFANVTAFTSGNQWANGDYLTVFIDTNGDDQAIAQLTFDEPGVTLQGPGVFRVKRTPLNSALGASSEQ